MSASTTSADLRDGPLTMAPGPEFVSAMANVATGVAVVATDGVGGRCAQTVSSLCSVSVDPPIILACINRRSPLVEAVGINGVFAVSILATGQAVVADIFAGRPVSGQPYHFDDATWEDSSTGAPALCDAAAVFDCRLEDATDVGTHRVLFGSVVACQATGRSALVYAARSYRRHLPLTSCGHDPVSAVVDPAPRCHASLDHHVPLSNGGDA